MNDKVKNLLGLAITLTVLILAYAAVRFVGSFDKSIQPGTFRSFSVTAEGKAVSVPDIAQFSFSVITQGGTNVVSLQKNNTEKVNKVIVFVKSKGVETKDIKTQSYSVEPRYQYRKCPDDGSACDPPDIVGYEIHQSVLVKVRNFDVIGDLLAGIVNEGANSVSQLSFTIDDPTEVQNQARGEAIVKAKKKAKSIAEAGGFKIGRLLSIEEGFYPGPIPAYGRGFETFAMESQAALPPPTIEPGSEEVSINVTLRYEIE